jgi:carbonic anhydrase
MAANRMFPHNPSDPFSSPQFPPEAKTDIALEDDNFTYALSSNAAWAGYKSHQNPSFFPTLATGQSPTILWLGCSDSRVPETTLLGLQPGDVFVHRNIANIISPTDINSSAVIEYAVVHLKVKHIVLCGHTSCGGAAAALGDARVGGVLDTWLTPLKVVRKDNKVELEGITDAGKRAVRLAELNVIKGVETLMSNYVVDEAIRERGLEVHGVLYDISCGKIRDLGVGISKSASAALGGKEAEKTEVVRGKHGMLAFGGDGATMTVR